MESWLVSRGYISQEKPEEVIEGEDEGSRRDLGEGSKMGLSLECSRNDEKDDVIGTW